MGKNDGVITEKRDDKSIYSSRSENATSENATDNISRRKMLASLGIAGATAVFGGILPSFSSEALANSEAFEEMGSMLGTIVDVRSLGAVGDGIADDTDAIQDAIDEAIAVGLSLSLPGGTYLTRGNTISSTLRVIGSGTLLLHPDATSDAVLTINGAYTYVEGITVDGNKHHLPGTAGSAYPGRGEGIRVNAPHVTLVRVHANNTAEKGSGNAINISGEDCLLYRCYSYGAGYGAFRTHNVGSLDDDNEPTGVVSIIDCTADYFKVKGYVNNGHLNTIILDNFKAIARPVSEGGVSSQDGVLFETGANAKLKLAILQNSVIKGECTSNLIKSVSVQKTIIRNCHLERTGTGTVFRRHVQYTGTNVYEHDNEAIIENSTLIGRAGPCINEDSGHLYKLTVRNCTLVSDSTSDCNDITGKNILFDNVTFRGTFSRWGCRMGSPNLMGATFRSMINESGSALLGWVDSPEPGDIKLIGYKGSGAIASNAAAMSLIQANDTDTDRIFYVPSGTVPSSARAWKRGDKLIYSDPSPGGFMGLICTAGGAGAEFKEFGPIAT